MIDILIAVLEELFSGKQPPQAQPRRRVQAGEEGTRAGATVQRTVIPPEPPKPAKPANDFESMVKRWFDAEEDEEDGAEQPALPRPARRQTPRQAQGQRQPRVRTPAPKPQPAEPPKPAEPPQLTGTFTVKEGGLGTLGTLDLFESSTDVPKMPDYIGKLRGNPQAAREAFVYAEIFGRPLADRR